MEDKEKKLLEAVAEYADIEIQDYDDLSQRINEIEKEVIRHEKVYDLPGCLAEIGYAFFLARVFGANRAFVESKFIAKGSPLSRFIVQEKIDEMMDMFSLGVASCLIEERGDIDEAVESTQMEIAEAIGYDEITSVMSSKIANILNHLAHVDDNLHQAIGATHGRFVDAFLNMINDMRSSGIDGEKEHAQELLKALSENDPAVSVGMITGVVMISTGSGHLRLELAEDFWGAIRQNVHNTEGLDIMQKLGDISQSFLRNFDINSSKGKMSRKDKPASEED